MSKEKLYESKKIKYKGAYHYLVKINDEKYFKHHNWDGPAIEPIPGEGSEYKKTYFIHGIEYSADKWKEFIRDREGLPFYKQSGFNVRS